MTTLEDFTSPTADSIDSFIEEQSKIFSPSTSEANDTVTAAHSALLVSGADDLLSNFQNIKLELSEGKSKTAEDLQVQHLAKGQEVDKKVMMDLLADPEVDDAQKSQVFQNWVATKDNTPESRQQLPYESLAQGSSNGDAEAEKVYTNFGAIENISELWNIRNEQQALVNKAIASLDVSAGDVVIDLLEGALPFVEGVRRGVVANEVLPHLKDGSGRDRAEAYTKGIALAGESKDEVKKYLMNADPSDQVEITKKLINAVTKAGGYAMTGENSSFVLSYLNDIVRPGGTVYQVERWIDNLFGLLDITIAGGAFKTLGAGVKFRAANVENMKRDFMRDGAAPSSPVETVRLHNPDQARAMHTASSTDEEAAAALHGTSMELAVTGDLAQQVASVDGSVKAHTPRPDKLTDDQITYNNVVVDLVDNLPTNYIYTQEKSSIKAKVMYDLHNVHGLQARPNMMQVFAPVKETASGLRITMPYGPANSGFSDPVQALTMAKMGLRDYGVTDKDLTLMRLEGDRYVETSLKDLEALFTVKTIFDKKMRKKRFTGKRGASAPIKVNVIPDYLVRVNFDYDYNPMDVSDFATMGVSRLAFFDRMPVLPGNLGQGTITSNLFDAATLFPSQVSKGATAIFDDSAAVEKMMMSMVEDFAEGVHHIPRERRDAIDTAIKKAMADSRSVTDVLTNSANGIQKGEAELLAKWKEYWDTHWVLENKDAVKSLRGGKYKVYNDSATGTHLYVKPQTRVEVGSDVEVYNPTTGGSDKLKGAELDNVYREDGMIAELKQPVFVDDRPIFHVKIDQGAQNANLREFNKNDRPVPYVLGYTPTLYEDPHFIIKAWADENGKPVYEQAIRTAGSIKDADALVARFETKELGNHKYFHRPDRASMGIFDDRWGSLVASGRTAQRTRGERVQGTNTGTLDISQENIMTPLDAAIHSARSISRRVSMRDYFEFMKARYASQFGHMFPPIDPKVPAKGRAYPSNKSQLDTKGVPAKEVADARALFEFIHSLENGYINGIDTAWRAGLNLAADTIGGFKYTQGEVNVRGTKVSGERVLRAAADLAGPGATMKQAAFVHYIATNITRQVLIQSHQAFFLAPVFPKYMATKFAPEMNVLLSLMYNAKPNKVLLKSLGMSNDDALQLWKDFEDSGLAAAIDQQSFVRGVMVEMAHKSAISSSNPVSRGASKAVNTARKAGFDVGETIQIAAAWLAHRNRAMTKKGGKLNKNELGDVRDSARMFTFSMNRGGDFPYNQATFSFIMQFMQVPHKAALFYSNKAIPALDRTKVGVWTAAMFSLPAATMLDLFSDVLPEDPTTREMVVQGLYPWTINQVLQAANGDNTSIDFSTLSPLGMYGAYETALGLVTTDAGEILANSPGGSLFFGDDAKISNWGKNVGRFAGLVDNYEDPVTFTDVAVEAAQTFSMMSNAFKGLYMMEHDMKVNSYAGFTDPSSTKAETIATGLFGLPTMDETKIRSIKKRDYMMSKELTDDVTQWWREYNRTLARKGLTPEDFERAQKVRSEAFRVWGNNQRVKTIIDGLERKAIRNADPYSFTNRAVDTLFNGVNPTYTEGMLNDIPDELLSPEDKDAIRKRARQLQEGAK